MAQQTETADETSEDVAKPVEAHAGGIRRLSGFPRTRSAEPATEQGERRLPTN